MPGRETHGNVVLQALFSPRNHSVRSAGVVSGQTLTSTIAELEAQDEVDQDAKYTRLIIDVANEKVTDPETIHATLKALGRDSSKLDQDLENYARVRADFDQFALLPEAEAKQAAAELEAKDARARITRFHNDIIAMQAQLALAQHSAERYESTARVAQQEASFARSAAGRLMDDQSRLRFLPDSFGDRMKAVAHLRNETAALTKDCGEIRDQINRRVAESNALLKQLTHAREQLKLPHLAGYTGPITDRMRATIEKNPDAKRNCAAAQALAAQIQNHRSAIDQNTRLNDEAAERHEALVEQLKQARAHLETAETELVKALG